MGTTLAALIQDNEEGLAQLQERIGYRFRDLHLLQLSLVHSSFAFERLDDGRHNETLEFLGDAVLDLTVGFTLFVRFPEMREGKLVVCKKYRGSMDKVYCQYIAERLAGKAVVADHAFITHSGEVPEETLSQLTALVRELAPFEEVFVTQAGCTVSSHCGPGTLGVLFLRKA